jgi:hypothetical protein
MSRAKFAWQGLTELKLDLQLLPEHLRVETGHLVIARANNAGVRIRTNYGLHRVTGTLQDRVRVDTELSRTRVRANIVSAAPHAHLFDFGTKARQTRRGWPRGTMPRAPDAHRFVTVMQQARQGLLDDLAALLDRHGLLVTRTG